MSYDYFIDSSVWMEYFTGSTKGIKSKEIIEKRNIVTSIITIAELADKFFRDEISFKYNLLFIQSRCAILPLSLSIVLEAAKIKLHQRKKKPKFGLADALALSTAQEKETIFVTCDNDFVDITGVLLLR